MALLLLALACGDFADPSRAVAPAPAAGARHAVEVHAPKTLGVVDTPLLDVDGTPVGVACATCHGPDPDEAWAAVAGEDFHTRVDLAHGDVSCASCHLPEDPGRLRLADGEIVPMADTMRLCAQCHGPQHRDWRHGSHGGMTGYWDLEQGPRTRNHCVDCHAPHAPAIGQVMPAPGPRDGGGEGH